MLAFTIIFWASVLMILFTYAGFPVILAARAARARNKKGDFSRYSAGDALPSVSVLIAAHNEEELIQQKLDNVFSLKYPSSQLEVIVASDGSTDRTCQIASAYPDPRLKLLVLPRQGKNATLNAAVSVSKGEILVFTDADTLMDVESLLHLIAPFKDPATGGVGGDYRYVSATNNSNEEKTYWKFDRLLKGLQSTAGNMTSATGQIYAIRKELFQPIPKKMVDDFYVSVQAPAAHKRLVFEPRAVAFGPTAEAGKEEFNRKVRVVSGGLRTVWKVRHLLNPARYGFYAIQLLIHKVLRRLVVIPLILSGISAAVLWHQGWIYQTAFAGQVILHAMAVFGYIFRNTSIGRKKPFSLPFFFNLVNLACLVAFIQLLTGSRHDIWKPTRAQTSVGAVLETHR